MWQRLKTFETFMKVLGSSWDHAVDKKLGIAWNPGDMKTSGPRKLVEHPLKLHASSYAS